MIAGIARQLDADATSMELESCVGTLNYMSPEVLQGIGCKDLNSKVSYSVTSLQSTEPSHQIQISVLSLTWNLTSLFSTSSVDQSWSDGHTIQTY